MHESVIRLISDDAVAEEVGDRTGGLRQRHHGVDDRVSDAAEAKDAHQVDGQLGVGRCREVDARADEPGQDVLQVIEEGAPRSLHVRVVHGDARALAHERAVLGGQEDLYLS